MYDTGLFIFRRDLRIQDNIGLHHALKSCRKVYTCFIFTPEQVERNPYKSYNAIKFMCVSLEDLAKNVESHGGNLITLYGNSTHMVQYLIRKLGVGAVFFNKDYSPYAKSRDEKIAGMCSKMGVECITKQDYYLFDPDEIHVGANAEKPYTKYTPFYNHVIERNVDKPVSGTSRLFSRLSNLKDAHIEHKITIENAIRRFVGDRQSPQVLVEGGRTNALKYLKMATIKQKEYTRRRDYFTYKTTFLSAALKFGCISSREMYWAIRNKYGLKCGLLRELVWRDFFAHILNGYPEVMRGSFAYKKIKWSENRDHFSRWKQGKTGFPLVDACMRQLNTTGYMHNRGRMLVATFLCKTLLLNWRWGEQYFAQKLTDYDPASNNGNWQSISSTGVDRKPYFRDMSPWIQMRKFDGDAEFIKLWVEELREVDTRDIMNWDTAHAKYPAGLYFKPMVDYGDQKSKMMEMYHRGT